MLISLTLLYLALPVWAAPFRSLPVRNEALPAFLEGSAATMLPSESWDHNLNNVDNLTPKDSHMLYYTDSGSYDPAVEHLFATIEAQYHYLAVATSHTNYIHSIACLDAGTLVITFNSQAAYSHVKTHWSLADGQSWVLVTHTSGCFSSRDGQNTFWLVSKVEYQGDDGSFKVKLCVEEIAISHCVSDVEVVWGTHTPVVPGSPSGSSSSPSGPAVSVSGSGSNPSYPAPGQTVPGSQPSKYPSQPASSAPAVYPSSGLSSVASAESSAPAVSVSSSKVPDYPPTPPATNSSDCGAFPGASYLGFPTAACGEHFDLALDAVIGYYGFDSSFSADLQAFAPGLDTYDLAEYQDDSSSLAKRGSLTRAIHRRGFFKKLKKAFKKVVKVVQTKVIPVVKNLVNAAKKIQAAAVKVVNAVKALIKILDNLGGDFATTFGFKAGPPKDSDSPWGRQSLIYQTSNSSQTISSTGSTSSSYTIGLWCVDCGVESRAVVQGSARFSLITQKVKAAYVQVSGSFGFQVALGVDAAARYRAEHKETLLSIPIPGTSFIIPGVLIFGGQASIGVAAYAEARASGRLLMGGKIGIPNYVARLDAVNIESSGVSGFTPVSTQIFEAAGTLDIDIGFALPIEVGFGISLPAVPSFGPKVIGLRDTPEYVANARGVYNNGWQTIDGCTGIPYRIDFHNRLDADAFGKIYPLARQDVLGLVKGCIKLGNPPTSSIRSSSTSSSRPLSVSSTYSTGVTSSSSVPSSISSSYVPSSISSSYSSDYSSSSSDYSSYESSSSSSSDYSSYPSSYSSSYSSSDYSYSSAAESSSYSYSSAAADSYSGSASAGSSSENFQPSSSVFSSAEPSGSVNSANQRRWGRHNRRQESPSNDNGASVAPEALAFLENDAELAASGNADLLTIAIQQEAELNPTSPDFDGAQYAAIMDVSNTYGLVGDGDGVLRFVDKDTASALPWTTFDATTVSDAQDRVLHYYPAMMAKFGVSRFRIQTVDLLPVGSEIAAMLPINADGSSSSPGTFVPTNTAAQAFYPIVCNLAGQSYSKMFLADSPEGVQTLFREDLRFILTGGVVTDCGIVQFVSSQTSGLSG